MSMTSRHWHRSSIPKSRRSHRRSARRSGPRSPRCRSIWHSKRLRYASPSSASSWGCTLGQWLVRSRLLSFGPHHDLDAARMRRQLTLEHPADLLPLKVGRCVRQGIKRKFDNPLRCGREVVIVRREPLQLLGRLQRVGDLTYLFLVGPLLSEWVIDHVDILNHWSPSS